MPTSQRGFKVDICIDFPLISYRFQELLQFCRVFNSTDSSFYLP